MNGLSQRISSPGKMFSEATNHAVMGNMRPFRYVIFFFLIFMIQFGLLPPLEELVSNIKLHGIVNFSSNDGSLLYGNRMSNELSTENPVPLKVNKWVWPFLGRVLALAMFNTSPSYHNSSVPLGMWVLAINPHLVSLW